MPEPAASRIAPHPECVEWEPTAANTQTVGRTEVFYKYDSPAGMLTVWLRGGEDLTLAGNLKVVGLAVNYWRDKEALIFELYPESC